MSQRKRQRACIANVCLKYASGLYSRCDFRKSGVCEIQTTAYLEDITPVTQL